MKDKKIFIDTNILLYRLAAGEKRKKAIADKLVNENFLRGVISVQVLREFFNGAVKKFNVPAQIAGSLVENYARMNLVHEDADLVLTAIDIYKKRNLSFYDSLIVSAAIRSKCAILYTEDLQHGQVIKGMKVINPFNRSGNLS